MVVARDARLRTYLAQLLSNAGYSVELTESVEHARRVGFQDYALTLAAAAVGPAGDALAVDPKATTNMLLTAPSLALSTPPHGALDPSDDNALLARVGDALWPATEPETTIMLQFADQTLDLAGHSLIRNDGAEIPLTRGEFCLLREFLQYPGRVRSRDQLLQALSGREAEAYDRSIDMLVMRLRRKIEPDPKRPTLISTVPGAGYKLTALVRRTTVSGSPKPRQIMDELEPHKRRAFCNVNGEVFSHAKAFQFGAFRLDHNGGLTRLNENGIWQSIPLEPRTLGALTALVERHGELVTKQALTEAAWPGIEVEPDSLAMRIVTLRRILDEGRREGSCIQTVARRGYRFALAVTTLPTNASLAGSSVMGSELRPRLSVAVWPFKSLNGDPGVDQQAEAIFDSFTADLSRLPGAFVVTGSSAGIQELGGRDLRQAGLELGVNYGIQGSTRRTASQTLLNIRLTDVESGAHLWAERLEVGHIDAVDTRDEGIGRVVRAVSMKLIADVNRRIEGIPPQDWTPYDLVMRGRALALRPLSARNRHDALKCYQQALELDPHSVWASLGICLMLIGNLVDGGSLCVEQDEARVEQLLFNILRIDADIPEVHTYMGMLRRFQGRLDNSKAELEIAVGLVRNNILATSQLGLTLIYLGRPDAALPLLEWCLRLAPHDPTTPAHCCHLGLCHLLLSRVDEATIYFRNARAVNPQLFQVHYLLAAALALQGDLDEARNALRRAVEIRPDAGSRSALNEMLRQSSPRFLDLYRRTVHAGVILAGISVIASKFAPWPD